MKDDKKQRMVRVVTHNGAKFEVGMKKRIKGDDVEVLEMGFNEAGHIVVVLEPTTQKLSDVDMDVTVNRKTIIFNHGILYFDVEELEPPLVQPAAFVPKIITEPGGEN